MRPLFKSVLLVTCGVVLATLTPTEVLAGPFVLAYHGQTYDSVHNDALMEGEYRESMRTTGWIELADPLTANCICSFTFSGFSGSADLIDFSFSDGLLQHGSTHGTDFGTFRFVTDSSARITEWLVYINDTLGPDAPIGGSDVDFYVSSGPSSLWPVPVTGDHSSSVCDNCDDFVWHGFDSNRKGRWTVVPEPDSFTLLLLGLAGLSLGLRAISC